MLAISAGTVLAAACGGTGTLNNTGGSGGKGTSSNSAGGAGGGTATSSSAGGGGSPMVDGGDDGAMADAPDDALDATGADGDGQTCAAVGQPCNHASDCCQPAQCAGGQCFLSVRRPFLVGSSLRLADAAPREDWLIEGAAPVADLDPPTREALARDWLRDGCEEHASIAAFARFTMHLVSVGAPPEMIAESQRASLDEIEHARACFALGRRYGGRAMGPGELSLEGALPPATLAEIAALAAEEGCVGETLGVLLAERQLALTSDAFVRASLVQAHIVEDEARHAELAWRFVAWAVARGGEPVRRAVRGAIQRAVAETLATPIRSYPGVDVGAWRAHGRLTCADAHAVAERGVREVVEPCAAALLGDPPAVGRSRDDRTCSSPSWTA